MALVCLLGRHGSGKSTIGAAMTAHGFTHISVGLLRRLAYAGQFPADIPVTLMMAMRRAKPGMPLSTETAAKLLKFASSLPKCVLDGFPTADDFHLLPPDTKIALVWTPKSVRETRLVQRADTTKRQWTPGRESHRERSLASLLCAARGRGDVFFIANRGDVVSIKALAEKVILKVHA